MDRKNQPIPPINLFWGTIFINSGIFWLLISFGLVGMPDNAITFLLKLSPLFWVILGIILFVHSDSEIEEVNV